MSTQSYKGLQLEFLEGDSCPICGTHVVIEESVEVDGWRERSEVREHAHGGKWEHRKFICGLVLSYCPNFRTTEMKKGYFCVNDPRLIERDKKRTEMKEKTLMYIKQYADVDEDFKNRLFDQIDRTLV
ncbi:hypothetical protein JOD82_002006 [Paenibacillus sp. 1182]|uniref:hypothetical protein n=1 Tax=Paenibacillus sp. 1182 TaxID=2806565 RepID=UPI001AE578B0|nr:hypothetical protein [Paenibacillus sp. 1182]MBP1308986.1 hypothetical protein [Paenibacillus sp. 1182]